MKFRFVNHTRYELYRLWRDSRAARILKDGARPGLFVSTTDMDRDRRRRLCAGLVKLYRTERLDLVEGGAIYNAVAGLVASYQDEGIPMAAFESAVRGAERPLGQIVIAELPDEESYMFVPDETPLDAEYLMLGVAVERDEEMGLGEAHEVSNIVQLTRLDQWLVRRILCRWIDDGLAYVVGDALDDDPEPFYLLPKAEQRLRNWERYEKERAQVRLFQFTIPVPTPLPSDYANIVRGIALDLGVRLDDVLPAGAKGVLLKGHFPEGLTQQQERDVAQSLTTSVEASLLEARRHEMSAPAATVTHYNTFNAQQVAAQGPNATAVGNTMVQHFTDGVTPQLLDELRQAREFATARVKNSDADDDDVADAGALVEAERAAKKNDAGGVRTALRRLSARVGTIVERLGLGLLRGWIFKETGIPLPDVPAQPEQPQLPPGKKSADDPVER